MCIHELKPVDQCFPTCVPWHTSVPREQQRCAATEYRKSKVFNKKFQWSFQFSLKTFDFLHSAAAHFYRSSIIIIIMWSLKHYKWYSILVNWYSLLSYQAHFTLWESEENTTMPQITVVCVYCLRVIRWTVEGHGIWATVSIIQSWYNIIN